MKILVILLSLLFVAQISFAVGCDSATGASPSYGKKSQPSEEVQDEGESKVYKTQMEALDRAYQEGALTKTEYIQRKRLLQEEEK